MVKTEGKECYRHYKKIVECQTGQLLQTGRRDRGGEQLNKESSNTLSARPITHQQITAYFPHQNG